MCKSIDAAVSVINKSIELAIRKDDMRYYMDHIKLHKLLYLAQCYTLSHYEMTLFDEGIEAHHCGPLVCGIDLIPGKCGFSLITKRLDPVEFGTIDIPLSLSRDKAIDVVLERYGTYSTDKIVEIVKSANAYAQYLTSCDEHPLIERKALILAGKELFG